jgi:hypothetical protein
MQIATADANLSAIEREHFNDLVLIYDNEPRNKDIVKQISKAIKEQFQVVICLRQLNLKTSMK